MADMQEHQKAAQQLSAAAEYCWEAVEVILGALRELKRLDGNEDLVVALEDIRDRCEDCAKRCEADATRHAGAQR